MMTTPRPLIASAPQISVYQAPPDFTWKPEHMICNLGEWIDQQSFCSEELQAILTCWAEARIYHGGGGAAEWAVKLYEPFDEDLDPWAESSPNA